jgi:hypothetical protein
MELEPVPAGHPTKGQEAAAMEHAAMTRSEWTIGAAASLAGIAVIEYALVSIVPLKVDWPWFNSTGIILISVAAGILGYLEPRHAWRWGVLPIAAVVAWMLVRGGSLGNLWPIFLFAFMTKAIPPMITAWIGAWFGRRRLVPPI